MWYDKILSVCSIDCNRQHRSGCVVVGHDDDDDDECDIDDCHMFGVMLVLVCQFGSFGLVE